MDLLGTQLKKFCNSAQTEILIAAPFIKAAVLKEILSSIKPEITIKCVSRWLIEEILAGVSDLEVWTIIQSYPHASLWLKSDLHAKYYRVDEQCLIGSANLTAKALGWSNQPNLELLVQLPANHSFLLEFEQKLFKKCIKVDQELYKQYLTITNQFQNKYNFIHEVQLTNNSSLDSLTNENWIPTLRNPEELYLAYSRQEDKLTTIALQNATYDLQFFNILPNLNQNEFKAYIAILLLEKPIIQEIDIFVKTPQRFSAVRDFLRGLPCANIPNFNPERAWQTLMRWLLYFLPLRYALSVPNHSEVFYRIR